MSPEDRPVPEGLSEGDRRYRAAGWVYVLAGTAVMAITVLTPGLAAPERRTDLIHLAVGFPVFVLVGWLIAAAHRPVAGLGRLFGADGERAERVGRWVREKLVMLLTLTSLGRLFVFACNGAGLRPRVGLRPFDLSLETAPAAPRMFFAAALMAVIVTFLARASWGPFLRRFRGPGEAGSEAV